MRYSRQEVLPFIPKNFHLISKTKKIVIVGCGGIGSPLAELLVRGGFVNLILIDNDIIDETNLQRQIFFEEDIGEYKANALKKHLLKIDKESKIEDKIGLLNSKNIKDICLNCDLIVDATDNFSTRKVINEFCEQEKKDWLYNGAIRTEIVTCLFRGEKKLFSKIFPKEIQDESCCAVGILASTTFASASIAYNQIMKYFLGIEEFKLIKINIWTNQMFKIELK